MLRPLTLIPWHMDETQSAPLVQKAAKRGADEAHRRQNVADQLADGPKPPEEENLQRRATGTSAMRGG